MQHCSSSISFHLLHLTMSFLSYFSFSLLPFCFCISCVLEPEFLLSKRGQVSSVEPQHIKDIPGSMEGVLESCLF